MKRKRESNGEDEDDEELIIRAVKDGSYSRVKELLENGANVDAQNEKNGWTALHWASGLCDLDMAKLLIANGADLNSQLNKWGTTPIHRACQKECCDTIKLLTESGADLSIKDNDGKTPLYWACQHRKRKTGVIRDIGPKRRHRVPALEHNQLMLEAVKLLLENGADPNTRNENDGTSPLYRACANGYLELVQLLLSRGANASLKTKQGSTPLQIASEQNHSDVVWFLVHQHPSLVLEGSG